MLDPREDLFYDFERDIWIETPSVHVSWSDRDLPAPATEPQPGVWLRPPPGSYKNPVQISLLAAGFLMLVLGLTLGGEIVPILLAGIALVFLASLSTIYRPRVSKDDRLLIEDPDDLDVCLVDVRINHRGRTIGYDRGAAWFSEGRLLFSGHATSFAIGGEDVSPRSKWHPLQHDRTNILPLRTPVGPTVLVFDILPEAKGPWERERRFIERLHAFRMRPPRSRGPRQWPPL